MTVSIKCNKNGDLPELRSQIKESRDQEGFKKNYRDKRDDGRNIERHIRQQPSYRAQDRFRNLVKKNDYGIIRIRADPA